MDLALKTEANLGWKCVVKYNRNRKLYTFNNKYGRKFIRKSINGGKVSAEADFLNRTIERKFKILIRILSKQFMMKFQIT